MCFSINLFARWFRHTHAIRWPPGWLTSLRSMEVYCRKNDCYCWSGSVQLPETIKSESESLIWTIMPEAHLGQHDPGQQRRSRKSITQITISSFDFISSSPTSNPHCRSHDSHRSPLPRPFAHDKRNAIPSERGLRPVLAAKVLFQAPAPRGAHMYQANIHPLTTSPSTQTMATTSTDIGLCPRKVLALSTACAAGDAPERGDRQEEGG